MAEMPHVFQASGKQWMNTDHELKGQWNKKVFNNSHPIILELGCGRGEYTLALSKEFPNKNFIGIDIKGARMWNGAKESAELKLNNVAFLRTRIEFINSFFATNEIDEIWLTFSDPQPRNEKKRLTASFFIDKYRGLLNKDGIIHVKTDSDLLYEFTMAEIQKHKHRPLFHTDDLYGISGNKSDTFIQSISNIKTFYEQMWLAKGLTIKYIKFHI